MKNTLREDFLAQLFEEFDVVKSEVSNLVDAKSKFHDWAERFNQKSVEPRDFLFVKKMYVSYAVLSVGRLLDNRSDVFSLRGVLQKLIDNGEQFVTKEWFVSQYEKQPDPEGLEGWYASMGADDFELFATDGGDLDIEAIEADLDQLDQKTKEIIKFRHKRIAHRDHNNNLVFDVNFDHLDEAIDTIDQLTVKYVGLLEQASMADGTMLPVEQ